LPHIQASFAQAKRKRREVGFLKPSPDIPPRSIEIQRLLTTTRTDDWLKNQVFSAQWWTLLILLLAICVIWWKLLDKKRARETCLYAALSIIFSIALNEYGEEFILWDYPTDIIPVFPPLSSINLILLPAAFSLVYQFSPPKYFALAALGTSAAICFIAEPLMALGSLYRLLNWNYAFNFILFFLDAMLVRFLTVKAYKIAAEVKQKIS
jgi:cbb3-type cytochrome oxidase subunit 3